MPSFNCDLCLEEFTDQFSFFEHLKQHYGPGTLVAATKVDNRDERTCGKNIKENETTAQISKKPCSERVDADRGTHADTQDEIIPSPCQIREVPSTKLSTLIEHNASSNNSPSESDDIVANRIAAIERIAENANTSELEPSSSIFTPTSNSTTTASSCLPLTGQLNSKEDIYIPRKVQHVCPNCSRVFKLEKKFVSHIAICSTKDDPNSANEETDHNESSKAICILEGEELQTQRTKATDPSINYDGSKNLSTANEGIGDDRIAKDLSNDKDGLVTSEIIQKINKVPFLSNATCILCHSSFTSKAKLDMHLKKIHAEFGIRRSVKKKKGAHNIDPTPPGSNCQKKPEVLRCTECERIFNHRNSLVYHMRSHTGERPHQCDSCGKSFFATSALKVHKRLHTGDKPFKCEHCDRYFRQWGDLKYHIISIHSSVRSYQCEYCGKDFARKYSLIVHRRIHTGERNYKCEYCAKSFRAASYLQNHRRIHTGEKPHSCTVCSKPFRVRSDMKRHMASHSREHIHSNLRNSQSTEQIPESLVDRSQVPNVITLNGFGPNQIVTIGSQQLSIGEGDTIQLMLDGQITVNQARQLAIDVRHHDATIEGEMDETPVITLASADGRATTLDGTAIEVYWTS